MSYKAKYSGLPLLSEKRFREYMGTLDRTLLEGNTEETDKAISKALEIIGKKDLLYRNFIEQTANFYSQELSGLRQAVLLELSFGHSLLALEGELPVLDEDVFNARWNATMHRPLCVMNIGANMPIIEDENPIYAEFIIGTATRFPKSATFLDPNNLQMWMMSDLSSGYMFLADQSYKDMSK